VKSMSALLGGKIAVVAQSPDSETNIDTALAA
jgi:hypothetical protein